MPSETYARTRTWLLGLAVACGAGLTATPAEAASMQKVDQSVWQEGVTGLPTYVNMYIYVPDTPAAKPPVVVVPHHCSGSASSTNTEITSLYRIADKTGFIVIIPEATGQNCWDAGSARSLKHGGTGDTGAVVQMVKYVLSKYQGDGNRVYTVGGSSGGIMTEALLGVYPDVFMAGVSLMGVPCGCWAEQYNDVVGKPSSGTGQWSGPCAGGTVTKTAQQWGDLVRSYFPGYTSHRPRLQHWHGTADTTLNYKAMAEDIKEWTNMLGLSTTPTATDTPTSGTTHQSWKNSCGFTVYETFSMAGVGHAVPFDGAAVAAYFGIDQAGGQDPETAACPGAVPGGSGNGGSSGASGGAAGSSGPAGSGGRPGGPPDGGADASDGASSSDAGEGSGGRSGSGGVTGDGGAAPGSGGATGSGGKSGTGGTLQATGGSSASGGTTASGGASGSGGSGHIAGSSASGGSGVQATGNSSSGCAYASSASGERDGIAGTLLMTAVLGLALRHLRRRARL